jgi:uncharacterized protein (DUF2236 family)
VDRQRQIYQLQYYTEGNVPEALIGVPENWNPDQIRQFQAYWDSLNAGDTAERRHAKFVPGGVAKTFVPVRGRPVQSLFAIEPLGGRPRRAVGRVVR